MYRGRYRARTAGSVRAIAVATNVVDKLATAPYSAYSVRLLRSAYAGPALRVRRVSDNTEQDIGFGADGRIDTPALLLFCAATNGFVTTWYDQTGNARHMTQATQAAQPQVVAAGVALTQDNSLALVCAAGRWMSLTTGAIAQPYSRSSVFQVDVRTAGHTILGPSATATTGRLFEDTNSSISMDAGIVVGVATGGATGASGQYTIAELYSGAASTRSVNGVVATIDVGTGAVAGLRMNADYLGTSNGATRFTEVLFWNTALDATSRQTLTLNQRSFFTTP